MKREESLTFTSEEVGQIEALGVNCAYDGGGYNKYGGNTLHWGFQDGKTHADLFYRARDVDGAWGTAVSRIHPKDFNTLIEVIKHPFKWFDTTCLH